MVIATFTGLLVSNSLGTGMTVFGSTVTFIGKENIFVNNTSINGGGLAVYGNSYIFLDSAIIHLTANHALRNGGGMFVSQPVTPIAATCFFQVSNFLGIHKIIMSKNTAQVAGSALYGGNVNDCTSTLPFIYLFDYTDQPPAGQTVISSDPLKVCLCTELNEVNCGVSKYLSSSVPGRRYSIPVCTVGNMEGLTPGVIAVNSSNTNNISLENTAAECKTLSQQWMPIGQI